MESVWSRAAANSLFDPLRRVYCFHGPDDRQKDEAIALLRAAIIDDSFVDFDFETIEADAISTEEILASAGLAPFGSAARLVVLRGAELYRRRERSGDAERLAAGLSTLGSGSCVVLRVAAAEDGKAAGKTVLTSKLDEAVKQHGVMVQCRELSEEALIDWVMDEAKAAGKQLAPDAARRIAAAGHGRRTAIVGELEKALCFAGDSEVVTLAMAEATCSYDPEDVMFRLVDTIARRNADLALRLFHEILRYDPKPQAVAGRLLALLSRQLRFVAQAGELARQGIDPAMLRSLPAHVAAELPSDNSIVSMTWKARDIFAQARGWRQEDMVRAFELMLECDLNNKGGGEGSEDVTTNVELLIVRLCRPPK